MKELLNENKKTLGSVELTEPKVILIQVKDTVKLGDTNLVESYGLDPEKSCNLTDKHGSNYLEEKQDLKGKLLERQTEIPVIVFEHEVHSLVKDLDLRPGDYKNAENIKVIPKIGVTVPKI